jgi:MFS family permease
VPRIARLTSVAIVARAVAIALFALTPSWPVAIVARWLHVGLSGVSGPLLDAWLVRYTPPAIRATVFSTLGQGDAFGQTFGGPLCGAGGR